MKGHRKGKRWRRAVDNICADWPDFGDLRRGLSLTPSSSGLTRGPIPRCSKPPPNIRMSNILHAVLTEVGVTEWVLGSSPRMTTLLDGAANLHHHFPHPLSTGPPLSLRAFLAPIDKSLSIGRLRRPLFTPSRGRESDIATLRYRRKRHDPLALKGSRTPD